MKVRAAVLNAMGAERPYAKSKPLSIEEVELKPPGPGEILVRMGAAGLCHSDLSVINGDRPRPTPTPISLSAPRSMTSLMAASESRWWRPVSAPRPRPLGR